MDGALVWRGNCHPFLVPTWVPACAGMTLSDSGALLHPACIQYPHRYLAALMISSTCGRK
jgi:hypothetical protein